ncbi:MULTISPECIES: hypothetical protein [unclassified Nostoc]|uniref:hypothetical protein n=1 Tax=unclassified Nostoc TaxID=2593658 RepID=UPI002AD43891|nr:hypothetical protein [Nostoc sp. DedQUE03]MDZ7971757.1 hypothetical protein [Nostoc sp. DedQUE03]MDZ8049061.1 hypothetical protein [Nostoc sp. DedQUE02]
MTWKTTFLFIVLATLVVILVGWLTSIGILPISQMINYSDAGLRFIRVWILLAIAIGLILPTITFVIWFKYPEIRKIFGFYLLVIIIQIVTEQIISIWLPSLVVIIGTLYTAFRVWQLWHEQQFIKSTDFVERGNFRIISSVLWLLLLFWSSNLIMLLTLSWPSIL